MPCQLSVPVKNLVAYASSKSSSQKNVLAITTNTSTTIVVVNVSWRDGQNTLRNSMRDSSTNCQKPRPYAEKAKTRMPSRKPPNIATQLAQASGRLLST